MKSILSLLLCIIATGIFSYLVTSFVIFDLNVSRWDGISRAMAVVLWGFISIPVYSLLYVNGRI